MDSKSSTPESLLCSGLPCMFTYFIFLSFKSPQTFLNLICVTYRGVPWRNALHKDSGIWREAQLWNDSWQVQTGSSATPPKQKGWDSHGLADRSQTQKGREEAIDHWIAKENRGGAGGNKESGKDDQRSGKYNKDKESKFSLNYSAQ